MSRYAGTQDHQHGAPPRTAVLLVNLGTPTAPTPAALRRYLAEFLSDPRVVEIPHWLWKPLLHGVILRTRPRISARKYAAIWTPEGSPLALWTHKQAQCLQTRLRDAGHPDLQVCWAMRYGSPSVAEQLTQLQKVGTTRILVLPLYPQYAGSTTASVFDAVSAWTTRTRWVPELRWIQHYHDDPGYISSLAARVRDHWQVHGEAERLLLSFHGVPQRTLELGDPYFCECQKTARLLREALCLPADKVLVTFQSRLGRAQWLQPYTEPTLIGLAHSGIRRVDAMCPGFASDNLETLEEINIEARAAFLRAGGEAFHYIPCLNDDARWINALRDLTLRHLAGWLDEPAATPAASLAVQQTRAKALGARA